MKPCVPVSPAPSLPTQTKAAKEEKAAKVLPLVPCPVPCVVPCIVVPCVALVPCVLPLVPLAVPCVVPLVPCVVPLVRCVVPLVPCVVGSAVVQYGGGE